MWLVSRSRDREARKLGGPLRSSGWGSEGRGGGRREARGEAGDVGAGARARLRLAGGGVGPTCGERADGEDGRRDAEGGVRGLSFACRTRARFAGGVSMAAMLEWSGLQGI